MCPCYSNDISNEQARAYQHAGLYQHAHNARDAGYAAAMQLYTRYVVACAAFLRDVRGGIEAASTAVRLVHHVVATGRGNVRWRDRLATLRPARGPRHRPAGLRTRRPHLSALLDVWLRRAYCLEEPFGFKRFASLHSHLRA